jgi:hypothetical protein
MAGMRLPAAGTVLAACLVATTSCRAPARELAAGPAGADGPPALVDALAGRFGPIEREPAFDALRPKLARAALVPSRVWDDASAWTGRGDTWRSVEISGFVAGGAYHVGVRASAREPSATGDYRSRIRLERIGGGRFEWTVREEFRAGPLRPADLARVLDALFRGVEGAGEEEARRALRHDLPRTAEKLSGLFRIETLALARDGHGATSVRLAVRLTPSGIRATAPRFAAYLEKYAGPMRLSLVVADAGGAAWWTREGADRLWTLRLRVRGGSLVPLEGAADRRLPERLRATGDYATRMGRFTVGARRIVADLALTRAPAEKGLAARFLEEPDWQLPFLVETFLDDPLRYPFEAPGSEVEWSLREASGGLLLTGLYRSRVRETWILRWLGGMVGDAVNEFRRGAEAEADRYNREVLLALRDDLTDLVASR